jgi:hypothetical protein
MSTYAISGYSSGEDRSLMAYIPPTSIGMQSLVLVALLVLSGPPVERITLCQRDNSMPYDVVAEYAHPATLNQLHDLIGGTLRQALAPYDVNVPAQVVTAWLEGNHLGVTFRAETSWTVQETSR